MPDPTRRLATHADLSTTSSSSSSSDSEESLSSSDDDANVHFYGAERAIPADEPRRVAKARRYILDALLAVFSILNPVQREDEGQRYAIKDRATRSLVSTRLNAGVHGPWSSLEHSLGQLNPALKDNRIQAVPELTAGLAVLDYFVTGQLIHLAQDKAYVRRSLSPTEAKATRPFLRQWDKLRQDVNLPIPREPPALSGALQSVPLVLLCRIASFALSPPLREGHHTLDLSRLPFDDVALRLEGMDFAQLLSAFGVDPSAVLRLSLARNKLSHFPTWFIFPFANLAELDASYNNGITHLPLAFTRLTGLKRVTTTGTQLAVFDNPRTSLPTPSSPARAANAGHLSLADTSLRLVLRYILSEPIDRQRATRVELAAHLAPHLADKLSRGYSCGLCHCITWPGRVEYADKEVEVSLLVRAEEGEDAVLLQDGSPGKAVRLRGRACMACARRLGAKWSVRWYDR